MLNTYTIALRDAVAEAYFPVADIARNLTRREAEVLAEKARAKGHDVVAFNVGAE